FAVVLGAVVLVANARALNLMLIGERDAFALGVETARVRWIVFVTASLLTAAAVSTGGAIGYVGLVVPHLIRLASGTDNRLVLPASALAGALLVLFADTTARTVIAPRELPTGAITALVGAPVLVYLLIGRKRLRTIGDGKLEIRDWRLEIGEEETGIEDEKLEIGVKKTEIGDEKLEIGDGGLEAEESNPHLLLPNTQSVLPTPQPPLRTPHSALRNQLSNLQSPILLRLQDVQFSYDHEILTGINLEVHTGEVVALLGPNGAGKSTLLNLAAGKLQPQAGEIFLQENPLTACSRREIARQTALVAQASDLHFPLTALEYVLAGRFANTTGIGFDTPGDIALALESLAATDTVQFAARHFNQLSSGEKQRVVLARALAQQPQLLLLDEPTANLDLAHQLALLKLVTQLTREQQLGALFVTHEINLAAEFADRIALLKDGKILACGTPNEVMTAELLSQVFGAPLLVTTHPHSGKPLISLTGTTP
ncbi:MAG TPA: iron chelate uptake ABC transporter family permease subunit, partial [Blastocatellia bacterium]|nr:iron chelate uptake ABC transporter family permease subunit [Blastocatellia bacterium]